MPKEIELTGLLAIAVFTFIVFWFAQYKKNYNKLQVVPSWFTPGKRDLTRAEKIGVLIQSAVEAAGLSATTTFFCWLILMILHAL